MIGNGLEFHDACWCAGTGCGGHLPIREAQITPIGWPGAAQHTYSPLCGGFHAPGPCPEPHLHSAIVVAR